MAVVGGATENGGALRRAPRTTHQPGLGLSSLPLSEGGQRAAAFAAFVLFSDERSEVEIDEEGAQLEKKGKV